MAQLLRELTSSPKDTSCVPWLHTMTQLPGTLDQELKILSTLHRR